KREFDIAQTTLEALNLSQNALQNNKQRYQSLIDTGWISEENAAIGLKATALTMRIGQGIANALGEGLGVLPLVTFGIDGAGGSPVENWAFGGENLGAIPKAIGEGFDALAEVFDAGSEIAAMKGEFSR